MFFKLIIVFSLNYQFRDCIYARECLTNPSEWQIIGWKKILFFTSIDLKINRNFGLELAASAEDERPHWSPNNLLELE